ncbi:MAG: HlyD family efflux transporter periplasmic adaptor subunit [Cyanobacteria bacterium SID2]|nr:HlyD family efflux transporter periplasmic adaptor subunit [Cyanobacteria bacterium SID2]MBP0002876.1 HlyD family efflux transporter periplasmic adaptor subunit [Cyanobacteria bacterium SBC]
MNSQPQPSNSPLKVVPPKASEPQPETSSQPPQAQRQSEPVSQNQAQNQGNSQRWTIVGVAVLGLGLLGFIPLPSYVTGEATISPREGERQKVTAPEAGVVRLQVRHNDRVEAGDDLAEIDNPDLDDRIAETERSIEQEESALEIAERELIIAQSRLMAAETEEANGRSQLQRQLDETEAATSESGLPQTRQVEREIDGIHYEIAGYENEVARLEGEIAEVESQQRTLQREIDRLYGELDRANGHVANLQPGIEAGAIAPGSRDVRDLEERRFQLELQIEQKEGELEATSERIGQLASQIDRQRNLANQRDRTIAASRERIQDVHRNLERELMQVRDEFDRRTAQRISAEEEVAAAAAKVQSHQQAIAVWEKDLERLQQRKADLTLTAKTAGTVITDRLDLRDGSRMEAGEEILSIVDLGELEARVQIAQGDKNLVREDQFGIFQTENQGDTQYKARVSDIGSRIDSDETAGTKPVLEVTLKIDNLDRLLLPGQKGHVHIQTVDRNLYQKIQHQFGKLFNVSRYFPWLVGDEEVKQ